MKRIIYSGFSNEYRFVIDYLSRESGWEPVLIHGPERIREWAKINYAKAVYFEGMRLRSAQFDYSLLGGAPVPVDAKIISALAKYEAFACSLMEDTTGWNFSFDERRRYYLELLKFCNTIIQHLKPDIFVSWTMPHAIVEYVLYQMCNYYNIPVLYINPSPLFNHQKNAYYHINISLEDQSEIFKDVYDSNKDYELGRDVREYFKFARSKEVTMPPTASHFFNNIRQYWNPGFWNNLVQLVKMSFKGQLFEKLAYASWKDNHHPFDSFKCRMNFFQYTLFLERLRLDDALVGRIYSKLVTPADLNRKYVYFAAPKQPEAGIWTVYQDQLLILDLLSSSIPDDWIIYYKEHPGQFIPGGKGSLARNEHFYEKISMYKNVRMIPLESSTFDLIDSAQAVVTPSGTVGWEAVVRGRPVMIFGSAWYQGCKSIMRIETREDCLRAIERIKNGYKPDQVDIERFAAAVERLSKKNILHGDFVYEKIKACPDPKMEMERIAQAIEEAHERHFVKEYEYAVDGSKKY